MLPGRAVCADGGRKKGDDGLNAAPANNWLLNVNDLDAGYGNAQVLWKVSLQVAESEIVGLLGGNGAGKTTLINTISGLVSQKAGTIHYAGKDITHTDHYARVRSGITQIPEGRQLFPGLTVRQNILLGAYSLPDKSRILGDLNFIYDLFPILSQREKQLAGTLLRGRAADVRDRQGAHVEPEAYTGRWSVPGACARDGRQDSRSHSESLSREIVEHPGCGAGRDTLPGALHHCFCAGNGSYREARVFEGVSMDPQIRKSYLGI